VTLSTGTGVQVQDITIAFGLPGNEFPSITANELSLLWLVRWLWQDHPLSDFWLE
jgi:hypothetical protein